MLSRNEESISYQYKPDSCECWLKIAHRTEAEVKKSRNATYWGLALVIKLLADLRIDERLSDTGLREWARVEIETEESLHDRYNFCLWQ